MDCTKNIANENKINDPLSTSGFQIVWLPIKNETNEKKDMLLDVELCNLKRAYNVPLESQDSLSYSKEEDVKNNNEVIIEEEKLDRHNLELCESQIINKTDYGKLSQNNDCEYKCCSCDFVGTVLQLRKHIKYCHPNELPGKNWCKCCQVNFDNETVFKQHQVQQHMFSCSVCSKIFTKRRLLLAHHPRHSSEEEKIRYLSPFFEEIVKEQVLKCTMCQKEFPKKGSLVKHMRIHSRESLKCSLCDFTCGKKVTLKMHFISHEGNRKYKCSHCDFSFKQIGHLKRHIARFNH